MRTPAPRTHSRSARPRWPASEIAARLAALTTLARARRYFNGVLFHNVQQNFIAQTGDPTGTGKGGDSIYKVLYGDQVSSRVAGQRTARVSERTRSPGRPASLKTKSSRTSRT